jgi:nicotinate phosphoribosyltransferase
MFVRTLPQDWGYFIAAGIDNAIDYVCQLRFTEEEISYLNDLEMFKPEYLEYLDHFRFDGDIHTLKEGTPFTAGTPIVRVEAKRPQAQLIETIILNVVNFQTLIASKASRIVNAAGEASVIDFGLRRAHGMDAGIKGARASYLAGVSATSNVEAARIYGIPPSGTMAHSFVMGFRNEVKAFRAYANTFPDKSVFVIDTYDTLNGARRAAKVAKEMESRGHRLRGVRLDSGNMGSLSRKVRGILDSKSLSYVDIVLSSDLNEYKIEKFTMDGVPVDSYGVGTEMITAKPVAALSGVYKLVDDNLVYRVEGNDGRYLYDILELEDEYVEGFPLLELAVLSGKRIRDAVPLKDMRDYCLDCVSRLPMETKKLRPTKPYQQRVGPKLLELTDELIVRYSTEGE